MYDAANIQLSQAMSGQISCEAAVRSIANTWTELINQLKPDFAWRGD